MSNSSEHPLIPTYRCKDCGSEVGFRSRRRSFSERFLLPLFLLRPVRCGECFRRDYRLIFTPVRDRLSDAARAQANTSGVLTPAAAAPATTTPATPALGSTRIMPGKRPATSDRNVA
ncbi:MAG TPA: hypothetical protein VMD99_06720 [Terriglobales bacterium]|nr:hypothetical protein [Terriglobales bacterium]